MERFLLTFRKKQNSPEQKICGDWYDIFVKRMRIFDVHIHIQPWWMMKPEVYQKMKLGHDNFDAYIPLAKNPEQFLRFLDDEGVERACLINYVSPDVMGFTDEVNTFISEFCSKEPKRLIPFGGIHPRFSRDVEGDVKKCIEKWGIKGFKVHPPHMLFYPNEYKEGFKPLEKMYQILSDARIPIMFHTGTSIFPGARSKYGDPMALDDVALDFPELKIILAHGGRPIWMETAFFLVRRHENIFLDISGIPPKSLLEYFPKIEKIADKTLFGSDWPGPLIPGIRKNAEDLLALPISDETKEKILWKNASKLFPL
ncbi:MAG: amidohydrolase family protein [bacterium JZ-2024 1]